MNTKKVAIEAACILLILAIGLFRFGGTDKSQMGWVLLGVGAVIAALAIIILVISGKKK